MNKLFFLCIFSFLLSGNVYCQSVKVYLESEKGDPDSQFNFGKIYDIKQDYAEAFKWFEKAARQGHAKAQFWLGGYYFEGHGVKQDYEKGVDWFRQSAEQGNTDAQNQMGYCYDSGKGVKQEYAKAVEWYKKAAEQGDKRAQTNLGGCYFEGHGVKQDYAKAVEWLKKAAEQGEERAQYHLGRIYKYVTQDYTEAAKWFEKAAQQGNEIAKKEAEQLYKSINKINRKNVYNIPSMSWKSFVPSSKDKKYSFKVDVKSVSKIEEVKVYVNGELSRGVIPVPADGNNMTIEKTVLLSEGTNTIKVEVRNAHGIASSEEKVSYVAEKLVVPSIQQKRIALVMGNAAYRDGENQLRNPVNDATDMSEKLKKLGFTVLISLDQTQEGMEKAIFEFGEKAKGYDVALFYYAGHGIGSSGSNFLVPVDAILPDESAVKYRCTDANLVLDLLDKAHCGMKIVILDACRNNPYARSWNVRTTGGNGGLVSMNAPKGTFIAFSTAPGEVAYDGKEGERNSPYTDALLRTLDVPNLSITDFFQEVLERVAIKTNEKQTPWTANSFRGKFVFNLK